MSSIIVANRRTGNTYQTDFATLVSLIKGTAITNLMDAGKFLEFGLSENLQVRIETGKDGTPQIVVFSTLNEDEVQPVRLQLINEDEEPTAALIGHRLYTLRQTYAITLLLDTERHEELAEILLKDPHFDLEKLLSEDERLHVQAGGPGTWWITVLTKVAGAPQKALNGLSLVYGEGRRMLLERVHAATDIKKEEAAAKAIANDRARDQRIIELTERLDKAKDPESRLIILRLLYSVLNDTNPQLAGPAIAGLLPMLDSKSP